MARIADMDVLGVVPFTFFKVNGHQDSINILIVGRIISNYFDSCLRLTDGG